MKLRRILLGLFATAGFFTAGCSGNGDEADPWKTFYVHYADVFQDCIDEVVEFRSNPTSFFSNSHLECSSAASLLAIKADGLQENGIDAPEFQYLMTSAVYAVDAFLDDTNFLEEQWQDCFKKVEQRLLCLDLIVSDSERNSDAYDDAIASTTKIEDLMNRLKPYATRPEK